MKDWFKYVFGLVAIILIGLFIYPTLYKFDKLEQKYPVKINRITGQTQILNEYGWTYPGRRDSFTDAIDKLRSELEILKREMESLKSNVNKPGFVDDLERTAE